MFSKSKINEPGPAQEAAADKKEEAPKMSDPTPTTPKAKPPASVLSADLQITGNSRAARVVSKAPPVGVTTMFSSCTIISPSP